MKLPAIQFYPGDWLRDDVAGCSLAAQGLWLRMLFLMHDSERYGYLSKNGLPIPLESIARRCGCSLVEFEPLLAELDRAGVPSRTSEGTIFSRRMVKDARERALATERKRRERDRVNNSEKSHADVTVLSRKSHAPSSSSFSPSRKKNTSVFKKPARSEIEAYFLEQNSNKNEAHNFEDYFDSNGWKVGGKTKMVDWQAAARGWISKPYHKTAINGKTESKLVM